MLWSKLFIPTLRENPAEFGTVSPRLLVRAGYVRQLSADRLAWLFVGRRVLRRIARIAREEMEGIGAQELFLPHADDAITVARELRSYRQLPQIWYRIRNEQVDAWSFGTDAGPTCERIFARCQLPFIVQSSEFLIESEAGESCTIRCPRCGFTVSARPSAPLAPDPESDRTPRSSTHLAVRPSPR